MHRPQKTNGEKHKAADQDTSSSTKLATEVLTRSAIQSKEPASKPAASVDSQKQTEQPKKIKWVDRSTSNPESSLSNGNCAYNSWAIIFGHNIDHFIEEASKEDAAERLPGLEKLIIKWNESDKSIHSHKFGRRVSGADGQMHWDLQGQALPFLNYIKERFQDVTTPYRSRSINIQNLLNELLRQVAIDERAPAEKEKFQYKSNFDALVISIRNSLLGSDATAARALKAELDSRSICTMPATIAYIIQKSVYRNFSSYQDVYALNTSGEMVDTDSTKTATPAESLTSMVLFLDNVATDNMPAAGAVAFKNYLYEAFQGCVTENSAQPLITLLNDVHNKIKPAKGASGNNYELNQAEVEAAVDAARDYMSSIQCAVSAEVEEIFSSAEQSERMTQFETARNMVNAQIESGIAGATNVDEFLDSVFENPEEIFGASGWDNGYGTGINRIAGRNVRTRAEFDALPGPLKAKWFVKASSLGTVWGQVETLYSFILNDPSLLSVGKQEDLAELVDSSINRDFLKEKIEMILAEANSAIEHEAAEKVSAFFDVLNSDSDVESASADEIRRYLAGITSAERATITSTLLSGLQLHLLEQMEASEQPIDEDIQTKFTADCRNAQAYLFETITEGDVIDSEARAKYREILEPALRSIVSARLKTLQKETYSDLEAQLPVSSDTATAYYRGKAALKQFWHEEGMDHYFDGLRQRARGGSDSERWGGEIELEILCRLFHINLNVEGSHQMNDFPASVTFHVAYNRNHYHAYWKAPADLVSNISKERSENSIDSSPINNNASDNNEKDESTSIPTDEPEVDFEDKFGDIKVVWYSLGSFFSAVISVIYWLALPPGINIIFGAIMTAVTLGLCAFAGIYYWKSCQDDSLSTTDPFLAELAPDRSQVNDTQGLGAVCRIQRRPASLSYQQDDSHLVDSASASRQTQASEALKAEDDPTSTIEIDSGKTHGC